jgi:hypothetical protein
MRTNWSIISASVSGKGHLESGIPCQDANSFRILNKFWGIAITCDGAGSYQNSQIGSAFITDNLINVIQDQIKTTNWFLFRTLPNERIWRKIALYSYKQVLNDLKQFSYNSGIDFQSTGCTVNLVLFCKKGVLTSHIGDGRACYKDSAGSWKSMITPFKGEEVGSTIFITTDWIWEDGAKYIETRVIEDEIIAFALLTDGMERASFLCYTKNDEGIYSDPNQPFDKFFNTNIETIKGLINTGKSLKEISGLWQDYLCSGNNLKDELDDKTMLVGILKH